MSVSYMQILHNTALRMNALAGTQVGPLETTYATANLTAANFKSADYPFSSFRDAIAFAEEQFAWAIAEAVDAHGVGSHPWRPILASVTAPLAHGVSLPGFDSGGVNRVIGAWGTVYDGSDNTPLVQRPLATIIRRVRNSNSHYLTPIYFYRIEGQRIYHTRTNVIIGVCIYNRATFLAAFNGNFAMLLPDVLEFPITALAIATMVKNTAANEVAGVYATYAATALAAVRSGSTVMPAGALAA